MKKKKQMDKKLIDKKLLVWIVVIALAIVLFFSFRYLQFSLGEEKSVKNNIGDGTRGSENLGGFCGTSTNGYCDSDDDCVRAGCSGEICASLDEPRSELNQIVGVCNYLECYNSESYGVSCGCVNNNCLWSKE